MNRNTTQKKYKGPILLVLGWDAGCLSYLEPLLKKGHLTNLRSLMNRGSFGDLCSTIPPMTPVAWSSILTGCNPGKHGIYDWWYPQDDNYKLNPYNFTSIRVPTLFSLLSEAGISVGAVNVPLTNPAPEVRGFVLSGISHPGHTNEINPESTYPSNLKNKLSSKNLDYFEFEDNAFLGATSNKELLNIWKSQENLRLGVIEELVHKYEPNLLWVHCHAGDYFGHRLTMGDPVLKESFNMIDLSLERLIKICSPEVTTIVISDHGQTEIRKFIMMQNWLEQKGLLRFINQIPKSRIGNTILHVLDTLGIQVPKEDMENTILDFAELYYRLPIDLRVQLTGLIAKHVPGCLKSHSNIDWNHTRAFSCGFYGQIRINLKNRDAFGIVEEEAYDDLVDEICESLQQIPDPETSNPIGIHPYRREQVYHGACLPDAPDIICELTDFSYFFCPIHSLHLNQASSVCHINHKDLSQRYRFLDQNYFGDHTSKGFYVFAGPGILPLKKQKPIKAVDITPTILSFFGIKPPSHMDGFELEYFWERGFSRLNRSFTSNIPHEKCDDKQRIKIMNELRNLGYNIE